MPSAASSQPRRRRHDARRWRRGAAPSAPGGGRTSGRRRPWGRGRAPRDVDGRGCGRAVALRSLPPTVMGVPANLAALGASRVLSTPGLLRAGLEQALPTRRVAGDVAVGESCRALRQRGARPAGRAAAGGVSTPGARRAVPPRGRTAAEPALDDGRSLLAAAAGVRRDQSSDSPVFAGLVGEWPARPRCRRSRWRRGAHRRHPAIVELLRRALALVTGPVPDPWVARADAVVLALPAPRPVASCSPPARWRPPSWPDRVRVRGGRDACL
jgi:hypothetical protein